MAGGAAAGAKRQRGLCLRLHPGEFSRRSFSKPQGTYMLFVDCTEWCAAHHKTLDEVLAAAWAVGVAFQDGRPFHGECSIRINLALPKSRVEEAFQRLEKYVFN